MHFTILIFAFKEIFHLHSLHSNMIIIIILSRHIYLDINIKPEQFLYKITFKISFTQFAFTHFSFEVKNGQAFL